MRMDRRSILKAAGIGTATIATGGAGLFALTGSGAAASMSIGASDVELSSDHGEIDRVSIQPEVTVMWDGFDEVVGKVRVLIEARRPALEEDYWPVFRATAWLNETDEPQEVETGPGYHGELEVRDEWFGGDDGITAYDREGRPDYADLADARGGGVTEESLLDGTSVGTEPPAENGLYGQAGHVEPFFNPDDGTTAPLTVDLRYTISLHAPNAAIAEGYDVPEAEVHETSPLVMATADDVDFQFDDAAWNGVVAGDAIPSDVLQAHADEHPAVLVDEASFDVDVENEAATIAGNTGGTSGTGGEASDGVGKKHKKKRRR